MKTKIDMDIKNIYIADSDILSKKNSQQIYSILCLCGNETDIQKLIVSFNKALDNLNIETPENISCWVSNDDGLSKFMDCLTAKNELTDICLSCLVSNHHFAMMVGYFKAITSDLNMNDLEIARTIESVYPHFEKKCIPLFLKDINMEVIEEIFQSFKKMSFLQSGFKGKELSIEVVSSYSDTIQ